MTNTELFVSRRNNIHLALQNAGISEILNSKSKIPDSLPCAVVEIAEETAKNPNQIKFSRTNIDFEIYLVVESDQDDPDLVLYELKESFREQYFELFSSDFAKITYYDSRVKGTTDVKIALLKTENR